MVPLRLRKGEQFSLNRSINGFCWNEKFEGILDSVYLREYEVVPLQRVQGLDSEIFTRRIWIQGQCMCHLTKLVIEIKIICSIK